MLPVRLMILPYLQHWDGAALTLRLLLTPQGDPRTPLMAGEPAFVDTHFDLEVRLIGDPGLVPTLSSGFSSITLSSPAPAHAKTICDALNAQLPIDPSIVPLNARTSAVRFMKYAPPGYRDATGYRGGANPFLLTDDTYHCAIKTPIPSGTVLKTDPPKLSWGKVIALAMRQPLLSEAIGLVRPVSITPPADFFKAGGWVYVSLVPGSPGAGLLGVTDAIKLYAARIPPLGSARSLFTPVLFPVAAIPPPGVDYDTLFRETAEYNDGFAKAVYARQPIQVDPLAEADDERPFEDHGIQLGWDDEQIVTWLNRQIDPAAATQDAPMGVFGYRVDAKRPSDATWQSLVMGDTSVKIGTLDLGSTQGEFRVEIAPNKLFGDTGPNYWVPIYYTSWTGPSLVAQDPVAAALRGMNPAPAVVRGITPSLALRYGEEYEFRVRFADHTNGGPGLTDSPRNPAPQPSAPLRFLRWVRPLAVRIDPHPPIVAIPDAAPANLVLRRPLLTYPAYVYAGGAAQDLLDDLPIAITEKRHPGRPDPDVALVEIVVQVECPGIADGDGFLTLTTLTRPFPADVNTDLTLTFDWQDIADARGLPATTAGAIPLPTSRNVRLVLTPLCAERADYFGAPDVRRGAAAQVSLRQNANDERLLLRPTSAESVEGLFLQPGQAPIPAVALAQKISGAGVTAPNDPMGYLAAALELDHTDLTLRARQGHRILFGCNPLLRHVIGPDGASLSFATLGDITRLWLVAVRLDLLRDWSWDGLDYLAVVRDGVEVGRIEPRQAAGHEAAGGAHADRTEMLFLDAIDPKPGPGLFPRPLDLTYRMLPHFRRAPVQTDALLEQAIRLPITTPPFQVPRLVSAGVAMSPYRRDALYSRTEERQKAVWLEFDAPPADTNDRYFARVLAYAADPVLTDETDAPSETLDPPLPINAEPIRDIVPGQADDQAGANAMQPLIATDSPVHFLLPLPSGLTADSPELFGFFTYEFRCGHTGVWTTAQGRYGRPLRVTGVQHQPPSLRCSVSRTPTLLEVGAAFADPVRDGRSVRPAVPVTELWALLYAQVHQADDAERRNVLLGYKPLRPARRFQKEPSGFSKAADVASNRWTTLEIKAALSRLTLGPDTPLSCLAVETLPGDAPFNDPVGAQLGYERFLRTSTLVQVPGIC